MILLDHKAVIIRLGVAIVAHVNRSAAGTPNAAKSFDRVLRMMHDAGK